MHASHRVMNRQIDRSLRFIGLTHAWLVLTRRGAGTDDRVTDAEQRRMGRLTRTTALAGAMVRACRVGVGCCCAVRVADG